MTVEQLFKMVVAGVATTFVMRWLDAQGQPKPAQAATTSSTPWLYN